MAPRRKEGVQEILNHICSRQHSKEKMHMETDHVHFPGSAVVGNLPSKAGGAGSIPGGGAKIPRASWPKK